MVGARINVRSTDSQRGAHRDPDLNPGSRGRKLSNLKTELSYYQIYVIRDYLIPCIESFDTEPDTAIQDT